MNSFKRAVNFIVSLVMLACSIMMFMDPWGGFRVVVFLLMMTLLIKGLRLLVYYFSMARHTVGGIAIFYEGILLFDAGVFALSLDSIPPVYTMIYLIICMLVSGGIDMMRSNESRKMKSGRWKLQMFYGAGNVLLAIVGVIFLQSTVLLSIIYGVSLFHSAVCRMITAFRRTAIVYIGE